MECLEYEPEYEYPEGLVENPMPEKNVVEVLPVSLKSAYDKFQRDGLFANYNASQDEKAFKNIEHRIQALKCESAELEHLVKSLKFKDANENEKSSREDFDRELLEAKLKIENIQELIYTPGHKVLASVSDILSELEREKSIQSAKSENCPIDSDQISKVTASSSHLPHCYKLQLDLDDTNQKLASLKFAEIIQKLDRIERFIGPCDPESLTRFPVPFETSNLQELVIRLREMATLTDVSTLNAIETKINIVLQLLKKVEEKKNILPDTETKTQIAELFEITHSYRELKPKLATINERLRALERVTMKGASLISYLDQIESDLKVAEDKFAQQSIVLNQLETSMSENMITFKQNCDFVLKSWSHPDSHVS